MAILSNDVYFSSFLYSIGAYCLDCIIIAFFYAEREREIEREREREGMGWIDYSYYFNFSDMYY